MTAAKKITTTWSRIVTVYTEKSIFKTTIHKHLLLQWSIQLWFLFSCFWRFSVFISEMTWCPGVRKKQHGVYLYVFNCWWHFSSVLAENNWIHLQPNNRRNMFNHWRCPSHHSASKQSNGIWLFEVRVFCKSHPHKSPHVSSAGFSDCTGMCEKLTLNVCVL